MDAAGVDVAPVVRAEQRLVRDGRARPVGRSRARRRGGGRSRSSSATPSGRTSTPSSPRVRRPRCRRRSSTRRSRSRPPRARRARRRSCPTARSRSTTRRSRCGSSCRGRAPVDASVVLGAGQADEDARRARVHPPGAGAQRAGDARGALGSPFPARARPTSRASFLRAIAELGATANTVDPVFQVMPRVDRRRAVLGHGRAGVPAPDPAPRAARRRRGVGRHRHQPARLRVRLRRDVDRRRRARRPPSASSSRAGATSSTTCSRSCGRARPAADLVRAPGRTRRPPVALVLLSRARHRHRQRRDAVRRHRPRRRVRRRRSCSQPGMVLVLEPVIWDDGHAGHRSEEIVAVTDDGYVACRRRARRSTRRAREPAAPSCVAAMAPRTTSTSWCSGAKRTPPSRATARLVARGHACVRARLRRRAGAGRRARAREQRRRRSRRLPGRHLYGITWNPEKLLGGLRAIPARRRAARRGRRHDADDARALARAVVPDAEFVDAAPVLAELVRRARPRRDRRAARGRRGRARRGSRRWSPGCARRPAARARGACARKRSPRSASPRRRSKPSRRRLDGPRRRGCARAARREHGTRRVARRRAARRVGGVARPHLPRRCVRQPARMGRAGRRRAGRATGRRAGHRLRRRPRREPLDDDFVLEPGMVVAVELDDGPGPPPRRRADHCRRPEVLTAG